MLDIELRNKPHCEFCIALAGIFVKFSQKCALNTRLCQVALITNVQEIILIMQT